MLSKSKAWPHTGVVIAYKCFRVSNQMQRVPREIPLVVFHVHHDNAWILLGFRWHRTAALHVRLADKQVKI